MYRNVYVQGVQKRRFNQQQNSDYAQKPFLRSDYRQFQEISPAVSATLMSYASPIIQKPYEKMSLNEVIRTLRKQGKIEGIDYDISKFQDGSVELFTKNKLGQPLKVLTYSGDNLDHVCRHMVFQYKNGREIRCLRYNKNNILETSFNTYYNDEIPQNSFTKEGITAYTKPDEYISYLEANNIKYEIIPQEYEDGRETLGIIEYDASNKKTQFTGFELNGKNSVMRDIYEQGVNNQRIEFDEKATRVTDYYDKNNLSI